MGDSPARRSATYEDLLEVPEPLVAELVDGEVVASPRPASPHAHAASVLGMDLGSAFQRGRGGPGGWWILYEPELHLGTDVLVPDLAGWRRSRMPEVPDTPYFAMSPDWVCEVVSPSTMRLDRVRKRPIYAREAVAHAWLVDPLARSLEVFRRQGEHWVLISTHADDERIRAEPFDEVELELGALWIAATAPEGDPAK